MFETKEQQSKFEISVLVVAGVLALLLIGTAGGLIWLAWSVHPALGGAMALGQAMVIGPLIRDLFK